MHHQPFPKRGMTLLSLAFLLFFSTQLLAQPTIVTADFETGAASSVHTLTGVPAGDCSYWPRNTKAATLPQDAGRRRAGGEKLLVQ